MPSIRGDHDAARLSVAFGRTGGVRAPTSASRVNVALPALDGLAQGRAPSGLQVYLELGAVPCGARLRRPRREDVGERDGQSLGRHDRLAECISALLETARSRGPRAAQGPRRSARPWSRSSRWSRQAARPPRARRARCVTAREPVARRRSADGGVEDQRRGARRRARTAMAVCGRRSCARPPPPARLVEHLARLPLRRRQDRRVDHAVAVALDDPEHRAHELLAERCGSRPRS